MDNNKKLLKIFSDLFEVDESTLDDNSSQETIERWDSLGMIQLVDELEMTFSIRIELLEIAEFTTLGAVRGRLAKKGVSF